MQKSIPKQRKLLLMAVAMICITLISAGLGRYWIDPLTIVKVLLSKILPIVPTWDPKVETVLFQIRLPRVIIGIFVGAGLSCAGCAYQNIFQNPMMSPDVLGASHGAALGAALGIFFNMGYHTTLIIAFLFGMAAVGIVCLISSYTQFEQTLVLILSGMMVGSLATACVSFLKLVADPSNQLPAITYWLMGSLTSARRQDIHFAIPFIIAGLIPLLLLRWRINLLTMGDDEARSMGIHVVRLRITIIFCATLITSACVSVSGMVGWVGLVVPHCARLLIGSDSRFCIPASLLLGGSFLLIVDNFARLLATSEIPIGILTAFIGAPVFLLLIIREGRKI